MYVLIESLRATFISIKASQFRAVLTSLGIIVGVASIITMVSVIQGLSGTVTQLFEGLGTNNLTISSFTKPEKRERGQIARIVAEDLELVRTKVDGISSVSPLLFSQANTAGTSQIRYRSANTYARVIGTTFSYKKVAQHVVRYGRSITDSDDKSRRQICVIGEEVRRSLELPENPVGKYISIDGQWIKIVGLMEPKGELLGFNQDQFVMLPYNTMASMIGNQNESDMQIYVAVNDVTKMEMVSQQIKRLLRKSHQLSPDEDDDFQIQSPEQLLSDFSDFVNSITMVAIGMISISLLVGGVGIMNIMLVSVNERTKEIGICKAIGAQRHHILLQFLFEALIICSMGGVVGVLIGYGLASIATILMGFEATVIPLWSIGLSMGFSVFIGVAFGVMPAAKAAKLDPIEALSNE